MLILNRYDRRVFLRLFAGYLIILFALVSEYVQASGTETTLDDVPKIEPVFALKTGCTGIINCQDNPPSSSGNQSIRPGSSYTYVPSFGSSGYQNDAASGQPSRDGNGSGGRGGDRGGGRDHYPPAPPPTALPTPAEYQAQYFKVIGETTRDLLWNQGAIRWINWSELRKQKDQNQRHIPEAQRQSVIQALNIPQNPGDPHTDSGFSQTMQVLDANQQHHSYFHFYIAVLTSTAEPGQYKENEHPGHRMFVYQVQSVIREKHPGMVRFFESQGWNMKQLFQKQPFIDDNLNTLFHHLNWTPERSQLLQQSITAAFDASDYWTVDIFDSVYPRLSSCRMLTMGDRDRIRAQPTTHQDKNRELMDQLQSYGSGGFLALLKGILRRPVWNHIVTDILSRFEDQNLAVMIAQGLNFSYISARRPEAQAVRNNRLTQAPAPAPARNRKIAHLCRSFQWNEADHLKLKRAIETGFDTAEMWGADIIGRIAPDLRSSGLLDSSDIQQIKANITSHDKNRALIEVLSTRESGAYLVVLEAIKKQRVYEHAVKTVLNSLAEDDSALAAHIAAAIQLSGYRVPQSTRPPSRSAHQEARRPVVQVIAAGVSHHTNSSEYSHLPSKERIERLRNVLIQWPLELATATLRQNSIIDQNDIQMINVRTTTQNKRDTLLDLILQRERGVDTFLNYCRSHTELGSVVQMINSGRGAQPQTHVSWQQGQVASSSTSSVSSRSPHLQQVRIVQTPHAPLAPLAPLAATAGSGHTQLVQDLLAESTRVSTEVDRSKHEKEQLELQVIELQSRMERLQTQKQPPSYSTGGASIGATGTGQSLSTLTTQGSSLTTQYELESLRAENAELLQWRKQAEESKHRMQYELEKTLECGICLQLKEGSMINSPCGHPFCEDCIQRVVQDDRVECPTCRASNRFDSYRPLKQSMPAGFLTNTRK